MGIYTFTGQCFVCKRIFSFHPNKVPSIRGAPICKDCVDKANKIRAEKGLSLITYAPDAYKCWLDEEEDHINWGD